MQELKDFGGQSGPLATKCRGKKKKRITRLFSLKSCISVCVFPLLKKNCPFENICFGSYSELFNEEDHLSLKQNVEVNYTCI